MLSATEAKGSSIVSIASMTSVSAAVMDSPGTADVPPGALIILRTSSSASAGDSPTTPAGAG
eukprot:14488719-Alexandrium_andersonii.AAC.1